MSQDPFQPNNQPSMLNSSELVVPIESVNYAPAGRYVMALTRIQPAVSQKSGKYLKFFFTVLEGPYTGYVAQYIANPPITPGNKLGKLIKSFGVDIPQGSTGNFNLGQLLNQKVWAQVISRATAQGVFADVDAIFPAMAPGSVMGGVASSATPVFTPAPTAPPVPPQMPPAPPQAPMAPQPTPAVPPAFTPPIVPSNGPTIKW